MSNTSRVGELVGTQYEIIAELGKNKWNAMMYDIKCRECGYIYHNVRLADIVRKIKNKEGCNHTVQHKTYNRWKNPRIGSIYNNMKERCYNTNSINYNRYGERGITICDEWLNDHTAFENWALSHGYQDTYEINRKDHEKGYSPENCEWVPPGYNSKFDRRGVYELYIGETRCTPADVDKYLNVLYRTTYRHIIKYGLEETQKWIDDIISGRVEHPNYSIKNQPICVDGISMSLADWCRYTHATYGTLYRVINTNDPIYINKYFRTKIIENIGMINVYGYNYTIEQLSYITNLDTKYIKSNYILFGVDFILNKIIQSQNIQVVDFSNWRE